MNCLKRLKNLSTIIKDLFYDYVLDIMYMDFQDKITTLSKEYNNLSSKIEELKIEINKLKKKI